MTRRKALLFGSIASVVFGAIMMLTAAAIGGAYL